MWDFSSRVTVVLCCADWIAALKLELVSELLGAFIPRFQSFPSMRSGVEIDLCISKKLTGDADAASPGIVL